MSKQDFPQNLGCTEVELRNFPTDASWTVCGRYEMVGFEGIDKDIWPVVDKAPKAVARAEITPGRCAVKQEDKLLDLSEFPETALAYEKEDGNVKEDDVTEVTAGGGGRGE